MENNRFLGELIQKVREEKNVSQRKLCELLCMVNQLSKIERGDAQADYFLLAALLERLGISLDKFELILTNREYKIIQIREKIEQELVKRNYKEVRNLLKKYQILEKVNLHLREQYIQKINVILLVEEKGDYESGIALLKNAILATIKISFVSHSIPSLLSLEDMRLLLLLSAYYFQCGKLDLAKELLQKFLNFLENTKIDLENSIKISPAVIYYLARIALLEGEKKRGNELALEGIYLLTKNGRISWLSQLLQLQIEIGEKMGMELAFLDQQRKSLQALEEIEQEFGEQEYPFCPLYQTLTTHEIYLDTDMIHKTRLAKKLSRREVTEQLCDEASLMQIETKKRQPSKKMSQRFAEVLGMKGIRFYTPIETTEFELHEKRWELDKRLSLNQMEEVKGLFLTLKKRLDTKNSVINQQYLLFVDTILQEEEKMISLEAAFSCYETAYFLTALEKDYFVKITEPLTRQEGYLLNQLALVYKTKGDYESALKVSKNILLNYQESYIEIKYYYKVFSILIMKLAGILEECGDYREAKKRYKEGILVALKNGRGNLFGKFLSEYAYTMEQEGKEKMKNAEKEACKKYFLQALSLSELFFDKKLAEIIKKYLEIEYG